jgi:putative FmdB family regulatory protein
VPTYVYECKNCEKTIEVEQRITEEPLKDCECGAKNSLRRLIQPVGVVFNGAGFHINDYASSPKGGDAKADPKPADSTPPSCGPQGCPRCAED